MEYQSLITEPLTADAQHVLGSMMSGDVIFANLWMATDETCMGFDPDHLCINFTRIWSEDGVYKRRWYAEYTVFSMEMGWPEQITMYGEPWPKAEWTRNRGGK